MGRKLRPEPARQCVKRHRRRVVGRRVSTVCACSPPTQTATGPPPRAVSRVLEDQDNDGVPADSGSHRLIRRPVAQTVAGSGDTRSVERLCRPRWRWAEHHRRDCLERTALRRCHRRNCWRNNASHRPEYRADVLGDSGHCLSHRRQRSRDAGASQQSAPQNDCDTAGWRAERRYPRLWGVPTSRVQQHGSPLHRQVQSAGNSPVCEEVQPVWSAHSRQADRLRERVGTDHRNNDSVCQEVTTQRRTVETIMRKSAISTDFMRSSFSF